MQRIVYLPQKGEIDMEEQNFKDYKEKQQYYKNLSKQCRVLFTSTPRGYDKKKSVIKGRTYINVDRKRSV